MKKVVSLEPGIAVVGSTRAAPKVKADRYGKKETEASQLSRFYAARFSAAHLKQASCARFVFMIWNGSRNENKSSLARRLPERLERETGPAGVRLG